MSVTGQWLPSAGDQEDERRVRVREVEADWDDRLRRLGIKEEREAVVRWLRAHHIDFAADFIEAGEHRKS